MQNTAFFRGILAFLCFHKTKTKTAMEQQISHDHNIQLMYLNLKISFLFVLKPLQMVACEKYQDVWLLIIWMNIYYRLVYDSLL